MGACRYGAASLPRRADMSEATFLWFTLARAGEVSINVVADDSPACYEYLSGDETHQNHCIEIERSYGLNGEVDIHDSGLEPTDRIRFSYVLRETASSGVP